MQKKKVYLCILAILLAVFCSSSVSAVPIDPIATGSQLADDSVAEWAFQHGGWYMWDSFELNVDAGSFGPGFAVFDLSAIHEPITSARLTLDIESYALEYASAVPIAIHDITNVGLLTEKPEWPSAEAYLDDFRAVKNDMLTGDLYGAAILPNPSGDLSVDIALSAAAIEDMNRADGGLFAVCIGPGQRSGDIFFPDRAGGLHFNGARLEVNSGTAPVPEPTTMFLVGSGLALLIRRRGGSRSTVQPTIE